VGPLVGATLEVDSNSLDRNDYVRVRIVVIDVDKISEMVEGAILPYLYDNKNDYVRVRITARDVDKIPEMAAGAILPYFYDFHYEREIEMGTRNPKLTDHVPNERKEDQPTPKKARTGEVEQPQGQQTQVINMTKNDSAQGSKSGKQ
jgi:hypothetical protein